MENYTKGYVIGHGSYGAVYAVTCRKTGEQLALKYFDLGAAETTVRELSCLAALRGHPNVIHMLDCFVDGEKIAMLMPRLPYTLREVIHSGFDLRRGQQLLPLSFVARFSIQVAEALSHMHSLNIVHRDLTPSNVLLTEDLTVKVADMGLSRQSSKWMSSYVVSVAYRAPELFTSKDCSQYTCAIDMWSLGVLIADAMERRSVFSPRRMDSCNTLSTYALIERTVCPAIATSCSPKDIMPNVMECAPVKRIVFRLLTFCHGERLLAHELLNDVEWTQLACVNQEDEDMVKHQIRHPNLVASLWAVE